MWRDNVSLCYQSRSSVNVVSPVAFWQNSAVYEPSPRGECCACGRGVPSAMPLGCTGAGARLAAGFSPGSRVTTCHAVSTDLKCLTLDTALMLDTAPNVSTDLRCPRPAAGAARLSPRQSTAALAPWLAALAPWLRAPCRAAPHSRRVLAATPQATGHLQRGTTRSSIGPSVANQWPISANQ
jgi:hypothetical protein